MAIYVLQNEEINLKINDFGAELTSITDVQTNTEYLWNANPDYWKRHSPVLFPVVGSLKNQSYTYDGKTYTMSQHGFARDMEFTVSNQSDTEIWFQLEADNQTKELFPFLFRLEIGYLLIDRKITVMWKVTNLDTKMMYFSIGAHPAFLCPIESYNSANIGNKKDNYYIGFDTKKPLHYLMIDDKGLAVKKPFDEQDTLITEQGLLRISENLFDYDALLFEDNQSNRVSLVTPDKKPYITVSFDAPVFGLWSPSKKNAPFICIEPWYGRCDATNFNGELKDREWGNSLDIGKEFNASYTIDIA